MRKAWIENAVIRDICQGNPDELYHPDIAALYNTDVPDEAANGDGWVDGQLVKPVIPDPVEPPAPVAVPPALEDQLKEGGRLVIPIGLEGEAQQLMRFVRQGGRLVGERITPVRFVPLV